MKERGYRLGHNGGKAEELLCYCSAVRHSVIHYSAVDGVRLGPTLSVGRESCLYSAEQGSCLWGENVSV